MCHMKMARYIFIVIWVTMNGCLSRGQMTPGFNLARLLQERTNRLQQMMLQSLSSQGSPFSSMSSPTPAGGSASSSSSSSPASAAVASPFIPVDQLLRQQRNMQSQLLQNIMNFQNTNQNVQTTRAPVDNTFFSSGSFPTGSNTIIDNNSGSRTSNTVNTGPPLGASSQITDFTSAVNSGLSINNNSQGLGNNGFSTFPASVSSFWTDTFQSGQRQSNEPQRTSGSVPTSIPTTSNNMFTQSSVNNQSPNDPRFSSSSNFGMGSQTLGSSSQDAGQTTGFIQPTDISNRFPSSFINNVFSGTGSGRQSTGNDFNSFTNTPSTTNLPTTTSQPALECTAEFRKMPGHTLCMTDSQLMTNFGVSAGDKESILQHHNQLRASVQPPAMDLMKLQWDERLAAVAEKWARQCTLAHDKERSVPELGMTIGQNVAVGYENWRQAVQQWYDEIRFYRYGVEPDSYLGPEGWRQVAHFTQIVQNDTLLIGCGFAVCPSTEYIRFFVCNYAAGQSDLATPYTAGPQCGLCPNNCVNGLCDCGDLVCLNKGSLNPSTCTCDCPRPYKGRRCEVLDCPAEDNWICGRDWPASYCDKFYNVPEECPIMCGLCPGRTFVQPEVPTTPNTTFVSAFGCSYTGLRDNQDTCRNYGDGGADMKMCSTEGGSVGCAQCDRYFNIKKDYCPVMCGLCDPPCGGKRCFNGGTLETRTCQCTCRKPFTGDLCDFAQCPVNGDPAFCRFWPPRYCRQYFNVPEECPYMCGICKSATTTAAPTSTGSKPIRMRTTEGNETP